MKKDDLEKLYQERFKDFHEKPDGHVWASITASLDNKKKKRIVPLWWKLGGIAALLAIAFFVINPLDSDVTIQQTTNLNKNEVKTKQELINDTLGTGNFEAIELTDTEHSKPSEKNSKKPVSTISKRDSHRKIANSQLEKLVPHTTNVGNQKNTIKSQERIAVAQKPDQEQENEKSQNTREKIDFNIDNKEQGNSGVAISHNSKEADKDGSIKSQDLKKELLYAEETVRLAATDEEKKKKSIFDAIAEQQENEETIKITEGKDDKWSVGPSVAPVFFSSMGQGSPIHSTFVENSKSGNVNLSLGITVGYNVGKRLKLRSGIHRVDLGYDTNDVVFSSSLAASSSNIIDNITFLQSSKTIRVEGSANNIQASPLTNDTFAQNPLLREGRMSQQIGYLEVPVELNYALVDKKLGVHVIGGLSSLFLVDNTISLESQGMITELGQANNLNPINFSGNLGLGINYSFSPKIQINLEPIFKYQLNTFSETAGSFNPYSVGVYSGVQLRF